MRLSLALAIVSVLRLAELSARRVAWERSSQIGRVLLEDLGDAAGAHGTATFTDREP